MDIRLGLTSGKMTTNKTYKQRMAEEYHQLKERYQKLHRMLVRFDAGTLGFELSCPVDLLREQAAVMGRYLYILEVRADIEHVDIQE